MTDIFFYHVYIKSEYEIIISSVILIIINYFIIRYGKKSANDLKGSKLIVLAGDINIFVNIAILFFPLIGIFREIQMEYEVFKLYYIISHLIVLISSFITYGVFITIFGIKNKGNQNTIPIATGVSIGISYLLQIITTIIYGIFLLNYSVIENSYSTGLIQLNYALDYLWAVYLILVNLSITTYLFGIAIVFGQSVMNDLKWLKYAMFLLLIHFILMTNLYWIIPRIQQIFGGM